jgi:MFS family permease
VLTFLTAVADCFDDPARQALIPQLVPHNRIAQATTLTILTHNIAAVAGPAVGGIAVAQLGISATYTIDAISFFAVILALLAMHSRPEVPVLASGGVHAVVEGLRFVRFNPIILPLMVLDFLATFFGASLVLLPIFAEEILNVGADGLGLLYAAPAAGAVAGGLVLAALPAPRRPGRMVLIAVALYGLAVAIFGATTSFPLALVSLAAAGAADTLSMTMRHTIRQLATPDELRGRIAAVHSVFAGGGPELGNFEAGVTANLFGTQPAVVLGGIASIAIAGLVALFSPAIRGYTAESRSTVIDEGVALEPGAGSG